MEDKIHIRPYKKEDRCQIRRICYETAFMGDVPKDFFEDKEILADAITAYYTDCEPESSFVAEYDGNVVGYLTGCIRPYQYRWMKITRIAPLIMFKYIFRGLIFNPRTAKFLRHSLMSFLKGEFNFPLRLSEYPAHLHINVVKGYRKMGIGSRLIDHYTQYLKDRNVKGVYILTISREAALFFEKKGFVIMASQPLSHLRYLLGRNLTTYVLVKRILERS